MLVPRTPAILGSRRREEPRRSRGLVRIGRIFELYASWKDKPPSEIKRLREQYVRPHVESFFEWVDEQRLLLKYVALGRRAWLFCGSDDHAKSTAALFSLVASARLHRLDPEEYLRCLIRLVPLWPEDRMLEVAPLFWERTRARLDAAELEKEIGWIKIPTDPLDTSATPEEQPSTR
jgi:transposase